MMIHSAAASGLLSARPAIFKQARKMAAAHVGGRFDKVQKFHDALEAAGQMPAQLCVASAKRGGIVHSLVFLGDEQSVLARLSGLKDPVVRHVPTPATVMAKMLARRLCKIHDEVVQENKYAVARPRTAKIQPLPDLEFGDLAGGFSKYANASWQLRKHANDAAKVLGRPEMTDEVKKKAWDVYMVHAVMHC